jgi:hypothetical protein
VPSSFLYSVSTTFSGSVSASVFSASTLAFSAGLTSGVGLSSFTVLVDFFISILPTTFI